MRFEHSICRYSEEDLIRRVFAIMKIPTPPPGQARACVEAVVKAGDMIVEMIGASSEHVGHVRGQQARLASLLELLSAPTIEPTPAQVEDDKQLGRSLCVVSPATRAGVEIHAGVGAIYRRGEGGTLFSEIAAIGGAGMDQRRDYLISVIEKTRDTLELTYS